MKSILLALLVATVVLFVAVESRERFHKRKNGKENPRCNQERPRNCSDFVNGICLECDEGYALLRKAVKFPRCNKTICVPCSWRLKKRDPTLYFKQCVTERPRNCSDFVNGICLECDEGYALLQKAVKFPRSNKTICVPCSWRLKKRDPTLYFKQCVTECPRNCMLCEEGSCKKCEAGFFGVQSRLLQLRTICVRCGPRMKMNWPDIFLKKCTEGGCGRGCANCSSPGDCIECDQGLKLFTPPNSNVTKCIKRCPPFYIQRLDGDSSPKCELKAAKPKRPRNCSDFVNGICLECDEGYALLRKAVKFPRSNKTICVPCSWRLKKRDPTLYFKQCVTECPRNCMLCEEGSCKKCEAGFFGVQSRLLQLRTICVRCGPRMKMNWPDIFLKKCTEGGCGRGCANCSSPGDCIECDQGLKLFTPPNSNVTKCIKRCPPFYTPRLDGDSSPKCELKPTKPKCGIHCMECSESGVCLKCFQPKRLIKHGRHTACMKQCPPPFKGRLDPENGQVLICEKPDKKSKGRRKAEHR